MTNLIRIFLGLVFLIFGLAKLFPIESFELLLVEQHIISWNAAPILARLIVFAEIYLGVAIVLNFNIRKTLWLSFFTLVFFTLYLIYDLISFGNREDCGCTGQLIALSTDLSLLKNFILLFFTIVLIKKANPFLYSRKKLMLFGIIGISLATILIIAPFYQKPLPAEKLNQVIDLRMLPNEALSGKALDYLNQELLLYFVSPKCSHCHLAMQKLKIMEAQNDLLPVYLVFYGKEENVKNYIEENDLDFPYIIFPDDEFMRIVSGKIPTIYHIDHGMLIHAWSGDRFDPNEMIAL